jgi:DNA-binding transcriptional ArsR family regulator
MVAGMAFRIHLTDADLDRLTVALELGAAGETVLALSALRCRVRFRLLRSDWRAKVSEQTARLKPLAQVVPAGTMGLDVATLTGLASTIEDGTAALLAAPAGQVRTELTLLDREVRLPAMAWAAAEPGSAGRTWLAGAVQAAHEVLIEPFWDRMLAELLAEQASRQRILAAQGPRALLASLQSERLRWRYPVLEIRSPLDHDHYLQGAGLIVTPSLFMGPFTGLMFDPREDGGTARLVIGATCGLAAGGQLNDRGHLYNGETASTPARAAASASQRNGQPGADPPAGLVSKNALAALLGRTRAAALACIGSGCTTTELAIRLGVSASAASQHATVLREAGLILTRRQGSAVLHTLTPLGFSLLAAGP